MNISIENRVNELKMQRIQKLRELDDLTCDQQIVRAKKQNVNKQIDYIDEELQLLGQGQQIFNLEDQVTEANT